MCIWRGRSSFGPGSDLGRSASFLAVNCRWNLDAHVTAVCSSGYYQLRQLRPIARSLSVEAAKSLIRAFRAKIESHGLLQYSTDRLARHANETATIGRPIERCRRLITGAPGHHGAITSQLHVRQVGWCLTALSAQKALSCHRVVC